MKIIKTADGKKKLKLTKSEWEKMGRKAGWVKKSSNGITHYPYQVPNSPSWRIGVRTPTQPDGIDAEKAFGPGENWKDYPSSQEAQSAIDSKLDYPQDDSGFKPTPVRKILQDGDKVGTELWGDQVNVPSQRSRFA